VKQHVGMALACFLVCSSSSVAEAETVSFKFTGLLTDVQGRVELFNAGPVAPGDPFSGQIIYDPATGVWQQPPLDFFAFFPETASFTVEVGSLRHRSRGLGFRPDSGAVFPLGVQGEDFGAVLFLGAPFPSPSFGSETVFGAFNPDEARFNFSLSCCDEDPYAQLIGRVTDFKQVDVAPVPEPATLLLFGTGIAGVLTRTRGRAKARRVPGL
jgi:PEP-CTERM motif